MSHDIHNPSNKSTSDEKDTICTTPLLPLRDIIVFPYMVVPLFVGREKSIRALEEVMASAKKQVFLSAQKKASNNSPSEKDIYSTGTIANILQLLRLPDGTLKVLIEGVERAEITNFVEKDPFFKVTSRVLRPVLGSPLQLEAFVRSIKSSFETYVKLNKKIPPELLVSVLSIEDPNRLADTIAPHLSIRAEDKQKLLEELDACKRLEKLFGFLEGEIEILQIEKKIKSRVKKQMEQSQKEYYLNEQMQAIQKELGERDEFRTEIAELEKIIKKKKLSEEATKKAKSELKKLKMISPMSAEATVIRNYLDWLVQIPWSEKTEDKLNIKETQTILDRDHFGLNKVKERIIEHLAVQSLVDKVQGPILCLSGPPGVGKTSLAESIARSLGRKFVKISLGGVRDEAEIRGHRRTYIGALPGKIIQAMKKIEVINPVILLDEVDKMSTDFRGDPSAALLEVLDPEQNKNFSDHYLEVDYDLSHVMFITTANAKHLIPWPLLDRLEVIELSGYTEEEKLEIANRHLVPKLTKRNGLTSDIIEFPDDALMLLIQSYTKEAGVRNLEREIASLCRKVAKILVSQNIKETIKENLQKTIITKEKVIEFLGPQKFHYQKPEETSEIGMVNGLAYTDFGGDLLIIEALKLPGKGKLTVTGKLGDVMQESAQAAMSYVRSRAHWLGLELDFYQKIDVHIHVPEGATPKDGPSAGITMAVALISALTQTPVDKDVAMTGEITLRGNVLPIGGLKEKLFAASRGGIKTVLIPKENMRDLHEVPPSVVNRLEIIPVEHMDQVVRVALKSAQFFSSQKVENPIIMSDINPAPLPQGETVAPLLVEVDPNNKEVVESSITSH